jgi:hypothetical protein
LISVATLARPVKVYAPKDTLKVIVGLQGKRLADTRRIIMVTEIVMKAIAVFMSVPLCVELLSSSPLLLLIIYDTL